jgi:uncharacterized protein with LGFP repeats
LKEQHAQEITTLVRKFEQERQAYQDIMRSKLRGYVQSTLMPKLKSQFKQHFGEAIERVRTETKHALKTHYERRLEQSKLEHQEERRVQERLFQERLQEERSNWEQDVRQRMDRQLHHLKRQLDSLTTPASSSRR